VIFLVDSVPRYAEYFGRTEGMDPGVSRRNPMTVSEYLAENANYIDEDSAARIEQFSPEVWAAVLEATNELTGSHEPGIACQVVTTHDTLEDFDEARSKNWRERGTRETFDFAGLPGVKFSNLQLFKGRPRQTQIVVDAGDVRICLL
jgi:hypothetical protein